MLGTLSPIVSISNIGTALIGLFKKPFDHDNPIEGTKQGILGLVKVFSLEGIKAFDTFFIGFNRIISFSRVLGQRTSHYKFSKNIGQVFKYIQPDPKQLQEDMNKFKIA